MISFMISLKKRDGLGRLSFLLLIQLILLVLLITPAAAVDTQSESVIRVYIDDSLLSLDVAPIIQQGRTLVPLRAIFEALGAEVQWNGAEQSVSAKKGDLSLWLQIGNTQAQKNGQNVQLDVPACLLNSRTLVPLRFVGEALGAAVNWDGETRVVKIKSQGAGATAPDPAACNTDPQITNPGLFPGNVPGNTLPLTPEFSSRVSLKGENFVTLQNGERAIQLKNGETYPLLKLEEQDRLREMVPQENLTVGDSLQVQNLYRQFKISPPQVNADLRQWQSSIKYQAGRNTCVSFALIAGMEALYHRLDPAKYADLDLSEQYLHHVQKMAMLESKPPVNTALRENCHAAWGTSNIFYAASLILRNYGIPTEAQLPYIPGHSYEDTNEVSDSPRINWEDPKVIQIDIDDFNLDPDRLPVSAIENAGYRITAYMGSTDPNVLADPDYYKAILHAGHEVVFAMEVWSDDPNPDNNIWEPGTRKKEGGHAMLMVGYDDLRRVFIVKNSWGPDIPAENGFSLLSYDYITAGHVKEALYITGVSNPPNPMETQGQFFLGRWKMDYDDRRGGTLDIYKLPGIHSSSSLEGQTDRRIGTFFEAGTAYRVNGTLNGNKLEFYIDFNKPGLAYGELRGNKFTAYLPKDDLNFMAGEMEKTNQEKFGFYATREDYLAFDTPTLNQLSYSTIVGSWKVDYGDGEGELKVNAPVSGSGSFTGTYTDSNGRSSAVTGKVQNNFHSVSFSFTTAAGGTQTFTGNIHTWKKGIISGYTTLNNRKYGFVATRFNTTINVGLFNAPSKLEAVGGAQSITLTWQDNTLDESKFVIERKGGDSTEYSQIATVGANVTTYTDTDVGRLSQYTYRVKAVKGASSSVYSNEASASLTLRTPSVTLLR